LVLVPTDFLPEFDELDLSLAAEELLSEELEEPLSLELELDLAGSDLAVESALSPDPLLSDFEPTPSPSPVLLPTGTPPFRLSVR